MEPVVKNLHDPASPRRKHLLLRSESSRSGSNNDVVFGAAVVAQRYSTHIITERLWALILPGSEIFSLLYPLSSESLIQVPRGSETLLIFQQKNMLSNAWIEQKK